MNERWVIRISLAAMKAKYQVPRGEASNLTEAIAVLSHGIPQDAKPVPDEENSFYYTRGNYRIVFEIIEERTFRVAKFERVQPPKSK